MATKTTDGTGTGSFTSNLTGLVGSTLYYVRAYATNGGGTTYGTEVSFTTTANPLPTLAGTTAASAILSTTATSGGNVTNEGTSAVTAKGVCWATTTAPTIALTTKTNDGTGTGAFTSSLTGLTGNTLYYVRAYATNTSGTSYGAQDSFTTAVPPIAASPTPTPTPTSVISIYSDAYTPAVTIAAWDNWYNCPITSTILADGGNAKKLVVASGGVCGTSIFSSPSTLDVSSKTYMHIDIYPTSATAAGVSFVAATQSPYISLGTLTANQWNSKEIALTNYAGFTTAIKQIGFNSTSTGTYYIDNIYFYKQDTWSGANSTNWATASNWASGAVPTATSDVVIGSGTFQPIITSDVSISSLTINSGKTLTVNAGFNLTVANAVANSGTMTLQSNANLLQTNAVANTGNIIIKRNSSSLLRLDHTLWSSPVASQNLYGFSTATLTDRFYVYDTATNAYTASGLSGTTTFAPGKGYGVRAPNDHSSTTPTIWEGTFTGVPNNGSVPFTLSTASSGYNLVGNPYPSPISATTFLSANPGTMDGTIYFYSHSLPMNADGTFPTGTNYSSWIGGTGTAATTATSPDPHLAPATPNGIIQVGQGFFVKATAAGTINFTNAMRVGNNDDQFLRTTEIEKHRLWLNLTTESGDDIN